MSAADKDPIIFSPPVRLVRSNSAVTFPGQMIRQIFEVCAVCQFPGARQSKDVIPSKRLNRAQVLFAGKARVSNDNNLPAPGGLLEAAEHLAEENVLMPFDFGINQGAGDRNTESSPLRDEQHQVQTEDIGRELV